MEAPISVMPTVMSKPGHGRNIPAGIMVIRTMARSGGHFRRHGTIKVFMCNKLDQERERFHDRRELLFQVHLQIDFSPSKNRAKETGFAKKTRREACKRNPSRIQTAKKEEPNDV